jgi:hypothetical protein
LKYQTESHKTLYSHSKITKLYKKKKKKKKKKNKKKKKKKKKKNIKDLMVRLYSQKPPQCKVRQIRHIQRIRVETCMRS